MDWSRFCHGGSVVGNDPGFAKLAATEEALRLARLMARAPPRNHRGSPDDMTEMTEMNDLEFEHLAFNEALYLPSFGDYVGPGVVKRTLNYLCFANSKTAFRFDAQGQKSSGTRAEDHHTRARASVVAPVDERRARRRGLRFYARGDTGALAAWRDGEVERRQESRRGARAAQHARRVVRRLGGSARPSAAAPREEDSHALGRHFRLHRGWSWGA